MENRIAVLEHENRCLKNAIYLLDDAFRMGSHNYDGWAEHFIQLRRIIEHDLDPATYEQKKIVAASAAVDATSVPTCSLMQVEPPSSDRPALN